MVEVHLYGKLRRLAEKKEVDDDSIAWAPWQSGDTVEVVLGRLGINFSQDVSNVFINGTYTYDAGQVSIEDAARLGVFPKDMSLLYM